jgi:hypothetical protein
MATIHDKHSKGNSEARIVETACVKRMTGCVCYMAAPGYFVEMSKPTFRKKLGLGYYLHAHGVLGKEVKGSADMTAISIRRRGQGNFPARQLPSLSHPILPS